MKILLVFLFIVLHSLTAQTADLGIKLGFTGGPAISVMIHEQINENRSLNLSIGGLPRVALIIETGYRLHTGKNWPSYYQTGFNCYWFFRGELDGKNVKSIGFITGITRPFMRTMNYSAGIGFIYAPVLINPDFKEEFEDIIPIVPVLYLELVL
ncbi:hypothetical protein ACFLUV_01525 [Elusimicrobiota bacterium]